MYEAWGKLSPQGQAIGRSVKQSLRFPVDSPAHIVFHGNGTSDLNIARIVGVMEKSFGSLSVVAQNGLKEKTQENWDGKMSIDAFYALRSAQLARLSRCEEPLVKSENIEQELQSILLNKLGPVLEEPAHAYRTKK